MIRYLRSYLILAFVGALLCAAAAPSQTFDPDPDETMAAESAAQRYVASLLGYASPPVGWICTPAPFPGFEPGQPGPSHVTCEPDPVLLDRQQDEKEEWIREFRSRVRSRSISRRR